MTASNHRLRVTKSDGTRIDSEIDQETVDSAAILFALDTPARDLQSGTIGFIATNADFTEGNGYVLWREHTGAAPPGSFPAARGGIWLLAQINPPANPDVAMFAGTRGFSLPIQTQYALGPSGVTLLANGSGESFVAPRAGTLHDLHASILLARGGVNTSTQPVPITVYVNDVATAITASIPALNSSTTVHDTTHTYAVAAGDEIQIVADFSNSQPGVDFQGLSASVLLGD